MPGLTNPLPWWFARPADVVVARLALILLAVYGVLILIVLVSLLIAVVSQTYTDVKASESLQMLRNKASVIDEIESILPEACRRELNGQLLQPYVHVLVPQQASGRLLNGKYSQRHGQKDSEHKLKKLKGLVKQGLSEQRAGEGKVERLEAAIQVRAAGGCRMGVGGLGLGAGGGAGGGVWVRGATSAMPTPARPPLRRPQEARLPELQAMWARAGVYQAYDLLQVCKNVANEVDLQLLQLR